MLTHISIYNVAIADHVELEFSPGMTVITGETGAGKSITLDALGLSLGDRADGSVVRHGAEKAEIHAGFDVHKLPQVQAWLKDKDLDSGDECLLRRVISREGRSRCYINGKPVTLSEIRALGEQLIDIHSQHEHQSLLKKDNHRLLLDSYGGSGNLANEVKKHYQQWQETHDTLSRLRQQNHAQAAHLQLLRYQIQELDELSLEPEELAQLEQEHQQLANADQYLSVCQRVLSRCDGDDGALLDSLRLGIRDLESITAASPRVSTALELLTSAQIQIEEARLDLQRFVDHFDADPARLQAVEDRLGTIHDLARKHRISPNQIPQHHRQLQDELDASDSSEERLTSLERTLADQLRCYQHSASNLSQARSNAATRLKTSVENQLKELGMMHCQFVVDLHAYASNTPHPNGNEQVEFLIAPNPGQPAQPLIRIASGGELSRISLAIQVVTAASNTLPTLAFDEVDVGIGGGTAEVVGKLLRTLGERSQVLCVTHQPQVASQGHTHLMVRKEARNGQTCTVVSRLDQQGKVEEIARMLGGLEITERTRDHAREMIERAS